MLPSAMFTTDLFMEKALARLSQFRSLTPGQTMGLLVELVEEEKAYLAKQALAPDEYDEIMLAQELMEQ